MEASSCACLSARYTICHFLTFSLFSYLLSFSFLISSSISKLFKVTKVHKEAAWSRLWTWVVPCLSEYFVQVDWFVYFYVFRLSHIFSLLLCQSLHAPLWAALSQFWSSKEATCLVLSRLRWLHVYTTLFLSFFPSLSLFLCWLLILFCSWDSWLFVRFRFSKQCSQSSTWQSSSLSSRCVFYIHVFYIWERKRKKRDWKREKLRSLRSGTQIEHEGEK